MQLFALRCKRWLTFTIMSFDEFIHEFIKFLFHTIYIVFELIQCFRKFLVLQFMRYFIDVHKLKVFKIFVNPIVR